MIVIQTNRIFLVPETLGILGVLEVKENNTIPFENENEPKKERAKYTKKPVKYFIPAFYI
jgi:hypothetical protein